jgi:predicted small secreted protein
MKQMTSLIRPSPGSRLKRRMLGALILPATALGFLALAACNTTAGVGRDLQQAGRKIETEAREHSP